MFIRRFQIVVTVFCKLKLVNSVTIVRITCIKKKPVSTRFQQTNFTSIFCALQNLIFSYDICHLLRHILKMQGSHFKIWRCRYNYLTHGY